MNRSFYPREAYQTLITKSNIPLETKLSHRKLKYLKVQHDFNQLAAIGRWQTTPLVQDCFQLRTGQFIKVQFHKPIPEGSRKHL